VNLVKIRFRQGTTVMQRLPKRTPYELMCIAGLSVEKRKQRSKNRRRRQLAAESKRRNRHG
jgi:hypothetical protein